MPLPEQPPSPPLPQPAVLPLPDQPPPPPPDHQPAPTPKPPCWRWAFKPFDRNWPVHYLGRMDVVCPNCQALHWIDEKIQKSRIEDPDFGMCCLRGKIKIPKLDDPPPELLNLLSGQDDISKKFHDHIRTYNNALAMTSLGCQQDNAINNGGGPYVFKVQGRLCHRSGSLIPWEGQHPVFAQLYIYDPQEALQFRMNHPANSDLHIQTMQTLQDMLHRRHPAVQLYKQAIEMTQNVDRCTIALRFEHNTDIRRYNLPTNTSNEIAVVLPGDGDQLTKARDIVLYKRGGGLREIDDLHPLYPSLHYVLLFPTGQLGWHPHIPHMEVEHLQNRRQEGRVRVGRSTVSQLEYFQYRLHPRLNESDHIFRAGKLFQEYAVDAWATTEQARLSYIQHNQDKIRAETYQGLADAVAADPTANGEDIGQRIILPSTFSGSSRYMIQNCQDALAINRHFHGADFFLTMTANPNWPEIKEALLPGQTTADRPDLVDRVFRAKVNQLKADLFRDGYLGRTVADVWTIEFQKRGLPHVHMIIFLEKEDKLRTPEEIDSLLSAEFPDEDEEPELLELVKKFMVHTPCGAENPTAPCMRDGKCSKGFPKPFRDDTTVNEDSYANLRRRDTGKKYQVGGHEVDNRWVVAYPRYLLWKYRCHINMECIFSVKAIKYIYKYVYKGHDHTTMEFGRCQDEIKLYLDSRYVSACEAIWRLLRFNMHQEFPNIVRLQVHLPNQQLVMWNEDATAELQTVVENQGTRDTTLTGYFKANANPHEDYQQARNLLYQDFPSKFVWQTKERKWTKRKTKETALGRIYYAHPNSGERFYLRTLLCAVKGATSFEDLRQVNGVVLPSFRTACLARGLLEDDNEWRQCLQEAANMASSHQLRNLFVTILRNCSPSDPLALWLEFRDNICDDIHHRLHS